MRILYKMLSTLEESILRIFLNSLAQFDTAMVVAMVNILLLLNHWVDASFFGNFGQSLLGLNP